ncbi:hypothetical protein NLX86_18965 [Streptomyces sp. A3M-1-3]|uniref:hypothetical protein n=1 Tax=Streptomyces sp. A3M-1-3 TaxID=2962044 RepID=UPI0020B8756B|nr:hypothetical protein [Streptomyces sp. A3M-1-3]MCP3820100.1 hypothetical protein [Streptomyces sp. A3M-1-3]
MTAPSPAPRPQRRSIVFSPESLAFLARFRQNGETAEQAIAAALKLRAIADGHCDARGRLKNQAQR